MDRQGRNKEIISEAIKILEKGDVFYRCTLQLQSAELKNVSAEEYHKIDNLLKSIRQDFAKILVTMNHIDKIYVSYQKDEFVSTYFSIFDAQATEELGCLIEYLFIKYRVMLEYVQKILELCAASCFEEQLPSNFKKLKDYERFAVLLEMIASASEKNVDLLCLDWFQEIRKDRNSIVHNGATCLVFDDKNDLLFEILLPNSVNMDEMKVIDPCYMNEKGLVYYDRYWAICISSLIVFVEMIFEYIQRFAKSGQQPLLDLLIPGRTNMMPNNIKEKQDILMKLLCKEREKIRCCTDIDN